MVFLKLMAIGLIGQNGAAVTSHVAMEHKSDTETAAIQLQPVVEWNVLEVPTKLLHAAQAYAQVLTLHYLLNEHKSKVDLKI